MKMLFYSTIESFFFPFYFFPFLAATILLESLGGAFIINLGQKSVFHKRNFISRQGEMSRKRLRFSSRRLGTRGSLP